MYYIMNMKTHDVTSTTMQTYEKQKRDYAVLRKMTTPHIFHGHGPFFGCIFRNQLDTGLVYFVANAHFKAGLVFDELSRVHT